MIWVVQTVVAVLAALLQATLLPTLFGLLPVPNLVLVATTLAALQGKWTLSLIWATVGGVTLDFFVSGRGFYTLALVTLSAGLRLLLGRRTSRPPLPVVLIVMMIASLLLPLIELLATGSRLSWQFGLATLSNLFGMALLAGILYLRQKPYGTIT